MIISDATINPKHMEMYAADDARAGVLEPEGTVEIRFRQKDLIKTMHRCDVQCKQLLSELTFYFKLYLIVLNFILQEELVKKMTKQKRKSWKLNCMNANSN